MKLPSYILLVLGFGFSMQSESAESAGRVIFTQGKVFLQREGTRLRIPISAGHHVRSGDVYRTAADSHLHIKLRKGGYLILRPEGRFILDAYLNRPEHPSSAKLLARLDMGVLRVISGAGSISRRDYFRLATPTAVIDTRGADFTTYADDLGTRISVAKGGIAMAPSDFRCGIDIRASDCEGVKELHAENTGMMLVVNKDAAAAEVAFAADNAPDNMHPPLANEPQTDNK